MNDNIKAIVGVIAVVILLLFARQWQQDREDKIRAEATSKAQDSTIQGLQKDITARDAQYAQRIQDLEKLVASVKTPQQAAAAVPQLIQLPAPVKTVVDSPATPNAPEKIHYEVPAEDAVPIFKALAQCKEDALGLNKCNADKVDTQKMLEAEKVKSQTWETTAKGGTKTQRFVRVLKFIGCSAGGAALGSAIKKSPSGAAIGGATGVAGCSIFLH